MNLFGFNDPFQWVVFLCKPMDQIEKHNTEDLEAYVKKLKELPPLDLKIEARLRALANAILDRLEERNNNKSIKEGA